jgi:glycosyltransferase involved in cell wall biosynthesis
MIRICSALVKESYDVLLVGREKPDSIQISTFSFSTKRLRCRFNKGFLFYLEYNIRLFFLIIKLKPGLICSIDLDTTLGAFFYPKGKTVKKVFDSHELFTELPEIINRPVVRMVWKMIGWLTVRHYDKCYTVNSSLAEILSKKYNKKFDIIRNVPLLKDSANLAQATGGRVIFYQGVLNTGRGLEELILSLKSLPNISLKLAGEGDLSQDLRNLVNENELKGQVEFLGFIKPENLAELTQQSWLGINLLESDSLNYYYSLANKFFDYIHAGIPMICMDFPEYKRINNEFEVACLIPDLEKNTLTEAIRKLDKDTSYYNKLKANCILARSKYKWQEEKENLLAIYENLLVHPN